MQAQAQRASLLERRHYHLDQSQLWDKLTLAQKFAANSLTQFGYDLAFIRNSRAGCLAIFLCNDSPATINHDGEIDTQPDIIIRN